MVVAGVNMSAFFSRRIAVLIALFIANLMLIGLFGAMMQLPARGPNVVDLELSLSPGVLQQIVDFWGPDRVAAVRRSIIVLDFFFPIVYAAFLSRLYISLCETVDAIPSRLVACLPVIAGAADYLENILLLILLRPGAAPSLWMVRIMSGAAITKFALLSVAAGFVIAALFKGDRGRVIRGARYSVLSLLIGTLPIIALDQGRDLLLGLADPSSGRHQIAFIFWTLIWALSVWYWSRVVVDAGKAAHPSKLYEDWATWLPRIAGFLTLFVPACACYLAARTAVASHDRLMRLFWACLDLSLLFLIYTIVRRRHPRLAGPAATSYDVSTLPAWNWIIFGLSTMFSLVMFAWLTYYPHDAGHRFGAVAILSIVGANTVFFGSIAVFATRSRGIPFEVVAFACAAMFSLWNDNHVVRLIDPPAVSRPELSEVFSSWVNQAPAAAGAPVPVIVAAAEGGGIRAAYWTSAVLHHLAEISDPGVRFPQRLFAISSVSGGSFGAAVYAGLRRDPTSTPPRPQIASEILRERFLAPMVAKLVTGDLAQWFWPFPVRRWDRSSAMEIAFANAYDEHVHHNSMTERVTEFRPLYSSDVPVLFLNSTSVEMGRRVVTTAYRWPLSDISVEEQEPIDFHQLTGRDVSLATAVHNTARFPYISSAGRLLAKNGENLGHLVDGGYFENTGADTLIDLLRYLKQSASPLNVRFIVVALLNTPSEEHLTQPDRIPWRDAESLGELFAPIRALLQTRLARGDLALRRLREQVEPGDMIEFRICSDSGLREAPLGWQLSKEMVDVLNGNLDQACFKAQVDKLKAAIRR